MIGPRTALAIASTASKSPWRRDREPGLDDVDPEARELLGDLELLADVERDAGRLLAVPQGRVEDLDVFHGVVLRGRCRACSSNEKPSGRKARRVAASTYVALAPT